MDLFAWTNHLMSGTTAFVKTAVYLVVIVVVAVKAARAGLAIAAILVSALTAAILVWLIADGGLTVLAQMLGRTLKVT